MNNYYITYQEDLYEIFFEISHEEFEEKEHFYNQYKKHLDNLDDDQMLKVRVDYIEALFFLGKYNTLLREIKRDLFFVIDKNIINFGGRDIYQWFLMLKGASHFNTQQYDKSIHVFHQLSRISKKNMRSKRYLYQSLIQKKSNIYKKVNVGFGVIIGLCLIMSLVGVILQHSFGIENTALFQIRNYCFGTVLTLFTLSISYRHILNFFAMRKMLK